MRKIAKLVFFTGFIIFSTSGSISAEEIVEIPAIAIPASYSGRGMKVFTVDDSWTVPAGVTKVRVELLGGGGSGNSAPIGSLTDTLSGGGGAGGYINATFPVSPGGTLTFIVAAAQTNQGSAGTFTRLAYGSMTLTAYGGGGASVGKSGNYGGAGGIGGGFLEENTLAGSVIIFSKGADGQTSNYVDYYNVNSGGGNGASSIYGGGGKGQLWKLPLDVGNGEYGAGGGGGAWDGYGHPCPGGTGGPGLAIVYW